MVISVLSEVITPDKTWSSFSTPYVTSHRSIEIRHGGGGLQARFKYPPHWVPLELLFKAMDEVDVVSGRKRGYILMKAPERPISLCYTLSRSQESWTKAEQYIRSDAPKLFNEMASRGASLEAIVRELVMQCPIQSVQKFVAVRVSSCDCATDDTPQTAHLNSARVVEELQSLPLYQVPSTSHHCPPLLSCEIFRKLRRTWKAQRRHRRMKVRQVK